MTESPSSSTTTAEADAGSAGMVDSVAATLTIVVGEDGVPVVDLREAPARDGALAVVDGELVLRLADGTEWPVDNFFGDAAVLQLGDHAFVAAEAVKAAVAAASEPVPVAGLLATPADAGASAQQGETEEAADAAEEPVSGGAEFRAFKIANLGDLLQLTPQLAATSQEQGGGQREVERSLDTAGTPGNGSRFVKLEPIANDDHASTNERQTLEIDVLANDRDPNPGDQVRLVGVDTAQLKGEVTITADGKLVYDPNGQFTHLGKGETATETFTYTVADRFGATGKAIVTVSVSGVNDAPQAAHDRASTSEKAAVEIDVLANDSDPDTNDVIAVQTVDAHGLDGRVTLLPNGKIAYDPNGQFTHLGKGEEATETFAYTVADQHGATSTATVTVTIIGVNDAPIAHDDAVTVSEKGEVRFDALTNDVDPDTNDTLRVTSLHSLGGSAGQRWINHEGTVSYRPYGAYDHLGQGDVAYQKFGYTVADQHGATSTATVTVKIVGVNDAPVAEDDVVTVSEKGEIRFDALANDHDPDNGDTIRVSNLFSLGGSKGQRWIDHEGTVSYRPYGAYDHLGEGEFAVQEFGYTVADQHGATDTGKISVIVVGVNDAPIARDDKAVTDEDTAVVVNVIANDYDIDVNDTIQVTAVDATGLKGTLADLGNGQFAYDPAGQFEYLGKGQTAIESFRYTISDQHGATSTATAEVVIHGVNDAPTAVDDHFVGFESIGFFAPIAALLANDNDVDHGDTLHLAGLGGAYNGEVTLTPDGDVVFTPTPGYVGLAGFQYAVQDQHGAYDIGEVQVDVRPITPGDVEYQTLSWFAALSDIALVEHADGSLQLDVLIEVGALATVGVEIGGMPFFSAVITGELLGVVNVSVDPSGQPQAVGNVLGFLDIQIYQSPIFQPLGGDFYDALLLATSAPPLPSGDPGYPALPGELDDLLALAFDMLGQQGLAGGPIGAFGEGAALGSALSFGNGTFYLDIAGVLDGLVVVDGEGPLPQLVGELFGQFAAAVAIDIRDGVDIAADGFLDGGFEVATSGFGQGLSIGGAVGGLVSEEVALAA